MNTRSRRMRSALMTGASTALLATLGAAQALAAGPSDTTTSTQSISVQQGFNDYSSSSPSLALNGNTQGSVNTTVSNNDATAYALTNSTVTVGSSATTGNASTATGYANTATLTVNGDLNNVTGSGYASETASSNAGTNGATVADVTDIGVALTQQNSSATASVTDGTDMGITIDHGMSGSTAKIAGNSQSATGVLNSGVTALDTSVNSTSGSSGIGVAQSSLNGSLTASVSSLDKFSTGSGPSTTALVGSTVDLTNNSQAATAVANSGSNSQVVSGNNVTLAGQTTGQASAGSGSATIGGYATSSKQELAVTSAGAKTVTASVDDAAGTAGYLASITGNVTGSTLANDNNSARALARGNEVSNATTIDANSIATGSLATPSSGTVAAIASQQDVTVATGTQTIVAQVGGAGTDGPIVSNAITGDVTGSSAITASNNSVLADAAANRGGNAITASATTINTLGTEVPSAGVSGSVATANAAFAVANEQSVASGTSVRAGLTDAFTSQTKSTDVSTAISGSLTSSSVASDGNSLAANAAGNATLGTGNAITLSGTNLGTSAAVANNQVMNGTATVLIGKAGTAATAPTTHNFTFTSTGNTGSGPYTFNGATTDGGHTAGEVTALTAQYGAGFTFSLSGGNIVVQATGQAANNPSFSASYNSGGSAGTPSTGGVIVTVGNDITGSSVTVDGNSTSGSARGNSATNSLSATATNLTRGNGVSNSSQATANVTGTAAADMAVSSGQTNTGALSSTVGALFGVSATGVTSPTLSDVSTSTVSVSNNAESSMVTGNAGTNSVALDATNVSTTSALANNQTSSGTLTATISDFSGANVTVGRDIANSSVLVDGNVISGATTGNAASNSIKVTGSSALAASDTTVGATAAPNAGTGPAAYATADHALANIQAVSGSETTTVTGTYNIATLGAGAPGSDDATSDITGSTLSVSDNAQSATTTGNSAANSVALSGGSISTNGALLSKQSASTTVTFGAASTMTVAAPAANSSSTLSLDDNSNVASSTVNAASNSMTVAADTSLVSTTVSGSNYGANASLSGSSGNYTSAADYVLNNAQSVNSNVTVTSAATTNLWNNDGGATGQSQFVSNGINQSTVDLSGNATSSTALSNRSTNTLTLTANSDSASAGVINQQVSSATVTANATTKADFVVAGYDGATASDPSPLDTSSVALNSNATTARAGGNNATNALSASATSFANTSAGGSASLTSSRTDSVSASFAVLNEQVNNGGVTAAANVTYGTTFNNLGTAPSVANSAVTVNGNSAVSVAYGNAATNSLTLTALNSPASGTTPTTTAIASNQNNTGAINASTGVTSGALAINAAASGTGNTGGVTNASLSINGNALASAAYGNSATNTLTIGGNNVNVTVAHAGP
jgi:hypothetical protein